MKIGFNFNQHMSACLFAYALRIHICIHMHTCMRHLKCPCVFLTTKYRHIIMLHFLQGARLA